MNTDSTTRQCPFCAETIKAEAVVCRYCGRDVAGGPAVMSPASTTMANRAILSEQIAKYTKKGWRIVSQTDYSVQLYKPKKWSSFLLISGTLSACIGLGLFLLLIAVIDYALQKEKTIYITAENYNQKLPAEMSTATAAVIVISIFVAIVLCALVGSLGGGRGSSSLKSATAAPAATTPVTIPATLPAIKATVINQSCTGLKANGDGNGIAIFEHPCGGMVTVGHSGTYKFAIRAQPSGKVLLDIVGSFNGQVLVPDGTERLEITAGGKWGIEGR